VDDEMRKPKGLLGKFDRKMAVLAPAVVMTEASTTHHPSCSKTNSPEMDMSLKKPQEGLIERIFAAALYMRSLYAS
jgi:hypothetical protein